MTTFIVAAGAFAQDAEFTVRKDLPYGDHTRQKIDIYSPIHTGPNTPVILFFHGGAWSEGTKDDLVAHAGSFAKAGVIFAAANYRLYPEAKFPEFAQDAAAATAFVLNELRTDEGNYRPVFVSGWSAGGYNAALVAYDERLLAKEDIPPGAVSGLIGLSGPYEGGLCAGRRCEHRFPEELRSEWNIAGHVDRNDPPMLLIAANEDPYVAVRHHEDLAEAARRAGIEAHVIVLPSKSHFATLGAILEPDGEIRNIIGNFIAGSTPTPLAEVDQITAPPIKADADGVLFSIGIEDGSRAEFRKRWKGINDHECVVAVSCQSGFPSHLHVASNDQWDSTAVTSVSITFRLLEGADAVLRLARAGAETVNVSLDDREDIHVTANMMVPETYEHSSVGAYELDLGRLAASVHTIKLSVVDDGEGNGRFGWDAITLKRAGETRP